MRTCTRIGKTISISALALLLMAPAVLAGLPNAESGCQEAAQKVKSNGLIPTVNPGKLNEQLLDEQAALMRTLFTDEELEELDDWAADRENVEAPFVLPSPYGAGSELQRLGKGLLPPHESTGSDDEINAETLKHHIEQTAEELPTIEILDRVVDLTKMKEPAVRSRIDVWENTPHYETWHFVIKVEAFCGGTGIGTSYGETAFKDKATWANEHWIGEIEVPLKDITSDLEDVEYLMVYIQSQYCNVGWFSNDGKFEDDKKCKYSKFADQDGFEAETFHLRWDI